MRKLILGVLAAGLSGACARGPQPVEPARMISAGDTAIFGPGPVAISDDGRHVVLELKESANVWFFNVHPDGWADLLYARPLPAGRTDVGIPRAAINSAGAPNQPVASMRQRRSEEQARRSSMSRGRLLRRESLLIVIWPRTVDLSPTFRTSWLLVDNYQPQFEVPEMMLEGRNSAWASYMLAK